MPVFEHSCVVSYIHGNSSHETWARDEMQRETKTDTTELSCDICMIGKAWLPQQIKEYALLIWFGNLCSSDTRLNIIFFYNLYIKSSFRSSQLFESRSHLGRLSWEHCQFWSTYNQEGLFMEKSKVLLLGLTIANGRWQAGWEMRRRLWQGWKSCQ